MEKEQFSEMLKKLHNELENTESVDDSGRELLGVVKDDISKLIDRPDDEELHGSSGLVERLKEAVFHFEDSHPSLASSMRRLVDTLSSMGI
ncbi:DUF4404 family protein [Thermodesulfobacteriota bacterium]